MKYSELYRLLEKQGWKIVRTGKHHMYVHPDKPNERPIPVGKNQSEEVPKGTLNSILRMAGLK